MNISKEQNSLSVFPPSFCTGQSMVLMREVVDTKQHNWVVQGTAGIGVAICIIMVKPTLYFLLKLLLCRKSDVHLRF